MSRKASLTITTHLLLKFYVMLGGCGSGWVATLLQLFQSIILHDHRPKLTQRKLINHKLKSKFFDRITSLIF